MFSGYVVRVWRVAGGWAGGRRGGGARGGIDTRLTIGTDMTRFGGVSSALWEGPAVQQRVGLSNSDSGLSCLGSCDSEESGASRERRRMIAPDEADERGELRPAGDGCRGGEREENELEIIGT